MLAACWRRSFVRPSSHTRALARSATRPITTTHHHHVPEHEGGLQDPESYCKELVRKRDYEWFLVSHFYPKELRGAFFALRAFYIELSTVQEAVSNSMLGKMRMQFWREAVRDIGNGRPPRHPIALALYDATEKTKLPPYHLKRIIDARDAELYSPSHLTVDSLLAHAESTSSTFLYLLLSMLSLSSSHTLSHAASHLGVSQTISTLLRALPYHAASGKMVIPAEVTARHGVSQEEVFRKGGNAQGIDEAVFEFATVANDHLITAREMFKESGGKVPEDARPVFLAAIPTALYLERLEKVNFDAFHPSLQVGNWRLPWRVWRGFYRGTF